MEQIEITQEELEHLSDEYVAQFIKGKPVKMIWR